MTNQLITIPLQRNSLHSVHITTMNQQHSLTNHMNHKLQSGPIIMNNQKNLYIHMNLTLKPIQLFKNPIHINPMSTMNQKLILTLTMNPPLFNGVLSTKLQALNSSIMNLQLTLINLSMNHLHMKTTITSNHLLINTNCTSQLQLVMKNLKL
jgi:hypothetical protein